MSYSYKGESFELAKDVLNLNVLTLELFDRYRELLRQTTKGIDRSKKLKYEKRISILQDRLKKSKSEDESRKLAQDIENVQFDFETDYEVIETEKLFEEKTAKAVTTLIQDLNLARKILPVIVSGKTEIIEYNLTDEFINFYQPVLFDFFFGRKKSDTT